MMPCALRKRRVAGDNGILAELSPVCHLGLSEKNVKSVDFYGGLN